MDYAMVISVTCTYTPDEFLELESLKYTGTHATFCGNFGHGRSLGRARYQGERSKLFFLLQEPTGVKDTGVKHERRIWVAQYLESYPAHGRGRRPGGSAPGRGPAGTLPCASFPGEGAGGLGGAAGGVRVRADPARLRAPAAAGWARAGPAGGGGGRAPREQCGRLFCRLSASFPDPPFHAPWPNRRGPGALREEPPYLVLERKGKGYPWMPAALGHRPAAAGPHAGAAPTPAGRGRCRAAPRSSRGLSGEPGDAQPATCLLVAGRGWKPMCLSVLTLRSSERRRSPRQQVTKLRFEPWPFTLQSQSLSMVKNTLPRQ
ncbi:collagen alpha-1(I) chain-like [Cebus imitator]|uniref:collagen alpha-1(I) chain-like n=1 Tax=Cebus imitator TaxID=2715852 RepID=UPI000809EA76|nr:collagen alpha-1(I) chain-like [Cebus imitator]